jgi:DNA-binding CsgD family transcriptional regulator
MDTLPAPLTITEILSKAPGNPVLWHLFLAELSRAMQCDSSSLSIADLGLGGELHHLYHYNIVPEQQSCFEWNFHRTGSFDACVARQPYRVLCSNTLSGAFPLNQGAESIMLEEQCRFGVSLPLNDRYVYCLYLNSSRPAAAVSQGGMHWLQALMPPLQSALQKEQWFSLYSQITLLTGKHVAAYLIIDHALNVLFSDPVFNRIIEDMKCAKVRGKRLAFLNKTAEERIVRLMAEGECDTVTMQHPCASCEITVIPARALDNLYAWEFHKKGVVLAFTHGSENNPAEARLMALYHLTKGEAVCALHFIATPSIPDIAAASHRSTETVRNHIKSIMQKLDVHNQGALMKKLLAIAAL